MHKVSGSNVFVKSGMASLEMLSSFRHGNLRTQVKERTLGRRRKIERAFLGLLLF